MFHVIYKFNQIGNKEMRNGMRGFGGEPPMGNFPGGGRGFGGGGGFNRNVVVGAGGGGGRF
jgi:hypothetical protein